MTREEAKLRLLADINMEIAEHGEDHVYMCAPQPGKNAWTCGEYKRAVENDEVFEGTGYNPIDDLLELNELLRKWKDYDTGR